RHAMQPGSELRPARLPALGMGPDAEKDLLRHLFGVLLAAEHAPCEGEGARKMAVDQNAASRFISRCHTQHKLIIRRLDQTGAPPCMKFARAAAGRSRCGAMGPIYS